MRAHSGYSYIWILPVVQVVAQRARIFYFCRTPFAAGSSNVRCEVECRRGYRRKEFAFFVGLQPALWLAFRGRIWKIRKQHVHRDRAKKSTD